MYEDLTAELRIFETVCKHSDKPDIANLAKKAAEAIEELRYRIIVSKATIKRQSDIIKSKDRDLQRMIDAKPQWIPVKESYPETNDEVLVTYIVNGDKSKRYVEAASWYDGDDDFWVSAWDEYRVPGTRIEIVAWMPFPKPYKPTEDEI